MIAPRVALSVFATMAALASVAGAVPVVFTYEGSGSGTLDGVAFSDRSFVISATGDTDDRLTPFNASVIIHESSNVSIDGIGVLGINVPTRTFANDGVVGFSRWSGVGSSGTDLYVVDPDTPLDDFDLLSSLGPVPGDGRLVQWAADPNPNLSIFAIETTGGVLVFNDAQGINASFTAQALPEPTAVAIALACSLLVSLRRRPIGV